MKYFISILFLGLFLFFPDIVLAQHETVEAVEHAEHILPAMWSVIPFVALLLMIATGPLFYAHFWHKYYPHVAFILGLAIVTYYILGLGSTAHVVHSAFEYFSFISLLTALFVSAGGILIHIDKKGTPLTNVILLIIGAAIANLVGTTGASMLLIRPFMRLNKGRIKAYHVIFFIFMISNVGGSLTPIGDPPLFLGFLKGVPFMWTVEHVWIYPAVILTSSDQTDALNQDITAPAEVQLSYSYRFNGYPIEDIYVPELKQHAAQILNNLKQDQSKSKYTSAWISNPMIDELVNNIIQQ